MKINTNVSMTEYSLAELRYSQLIAEKGLTYSVQESWDHTRPKYSKFVHEYKINPEIIIEATVDNAVVLYEFEDGVGLVDFSKSKVVAWLASANRDSIAAQFLNLRKTYVPSPDAAADRVKIRFWYVTSNGPKNVTREVIVPKWDNIVKNYNPDTFKDLNYLMNEFRPSSAGGQLLILYGPPGTGKSYSLRALLHSWKDWCTAEYILDPENLFSGAQGYMADLVLRGPSDYDPDYEEDEDKAGKWKLLILEDSGELLSADAKSRTGQGLSRLLNLVDGLIGQGLRVLVLITTNEELKNLHPAVSREGRCAAAINYKTFNRLAAQAWLNEKNINTVVMNGKLEYTLSDLFALSKEVKSPIHMPQLKEFGFKIKV